MDNDVIAKKLLTSKNSRAISGAIPLLNLDNISLKERTKYISISDFEQREKFIFDGTCEVMGKDIIRRANEFFILFRYFMTDDYQDNVKNDFTLFDNWVVSDSDLIRAALNLVDAIYGPPEKDFFGFISREIIGYKYNITFSVDSKIGELIKHSKEDEIFLFNGEKNG